MPHDPIISTTRRGRRVFLLQVGDRTYEHRTRKEAMAQRTAINMSRARASGHHLPPNPHRHCGKCKV